jgi:hypothetical protein
MPFGFNWRVEALFGVIVKSGLPKHSTFNQTGFAIAPASMPLYLRKHIL